MENLVQTLIQQRAIPAALEMSQYIQEPITKVLMEIQSYHYMNDHVKAYDLIQSQKEEMRKQYYTWYSLIKSIYRYRHKRKFDCAKDCLPSHHMYSYLFPPVTFDNKLQIETVIEKYMTGLRWLASKTKDDFLDFQINLQQLVTVSLPLCYQGVNLDKLQTMKNQVFSKFFHLNCHTPITLAPREKIWIGFITLHAIKDHAVMRDRLGLIQHLDRNKFKVVMISFFPTDLSLNETSLVVLSQTSLEQQVKSLGLDILFYCDLGMDGLTYQLASQRLAPVQITTWGHSDTSGCLEIDYYVTSKHFYNNHHKFTEKIVLLNSLSTLYTPLPHMGMFSGMMPRERKAAARRILRENSLVDLQDTDFVLFIGSNPIKIHPSFCKMLNELLTERGDKFLLPSGNHIEEANAVCRRLNHLPIIKVPSVTPLLFSIYLCAADLFLDTYPFGSCNSVIECFGFGVPFVSRPSKFQYGCFVKGFVEYTESAVLRNLIVDDGVQYAEMVDDLRDVMVQDRIASELMCNYDKLVNDKTTIRQYENFFASVVRK